MLAGVVSLQLNCTMPAGYGRYHPVMVTAEGQSSAPFYFDYDPPQLRSVVPVRDVYADTGRGARFVYILRDALLWGRFLYRVW